MQLGIIRQLDSCDPRSLGHSSHKQQWLELAGVLGRAMADQDWEKEQDAKDSRDLRKVLQ